MYTEETMKYDIFMVRFREMKIKYLTIQSEEEGAPAPWAKTRTGVIFSGDDDDEPFVSSSLLEFLRLRFEGGEEAIPQKRNKKKKTKTPRNGI